MPNRIGSVPRDVLASSANSERVHPQEAQHDTRGRLGDCAEAGWGATAEVQQDRIEFVLADEVVERLAVG